MDSMKPFLEDLEAAIRDARANGIKTETVGERILEELKVQTKDWTKDDALEALLTVSLIYIHDKILLTGN